jgi:hypothetical protein
MQASIPGTGGLISTFYTEEACELARASLRISAVTWYPAMSHARIAGRVD